ncbi:MAG: adenylate/guanylate cyclase domain-containing protein [Burkholderiales bacterium]|nr:adenylate/guanylate cyclase domain-containing protein [Nitrosomonas sp.]MCP5276380.1 adenylate/guanylate cyclase domain-containing protein [Burkholderiales bacterium]
MTKHVRRLLLGIFIGLLGIAVYLTPQGWSLEEEYGLYWLFQLRGPAPAPDDVMVIAIDSQSANKLELAAKPPYFWPWPRDTHAQLIDRLNGAGAQVIVLDLIFNHKTTSEHDRQLAEAIRNAGNVIVVERLHNEQLDLTNDLSNTLPLKLVKRTSVPLQKEISAAVLAHSPFPLPDKPRINAYWAFKPGMGDAPTIPAIVLQAYTREVYEVFIALLGKAHQSDAALFPRYQDLTNNLESVIFFLRQLFVNHPDIRQKLAAELRNNTLLDDRQKHLIQAMINLYSGQEAYYLNFYGPPRTIKTIPYYQFLTPSAGNNELSHTALEQVRNKVVFIGLSATTQSENEIIRDAYHSVFTDPEGVKISGVEIAATAFANLLENKPVRPFPYAGSLGLLFIMGLTLGFLFPSLSYKTLTATSIVLASAYAGFAWLLFKQAGIWLPLIIPLFIVIPGAIVGAILLMHLTAREERDQLLKLFGQFTPGRVVGDLTRQVNSVLHKDQLAFGAILFTDVKGYTTLAEAMDVRQLRLLMDDYFNVLSRSVKENNGVVSEKIGDAMLAIWEATSASKTLREQACEAGLAIVNNIHQFNKESNHPRLPTRIGIHFGELLVGKLGSLDNYIYRVIGDLVNTTSRIEGTNKYLGTNLLVTSELINGIDRFLTRPVGSFLFAGKSLPVNLSELITCRQEASDRQLLLCDMFSDALNAYQLQRHSAIQKWTEILKLFPDDGPAKFYLHICLQSPPDQWKPVIEFTEK